MRKWVFAACATCTAWLIVQNFVLLAFALGALVKP